MTESQTPDTLVGIPIDGPPQVAASQELESAKERLERAQALGKSVREVTDEASAQQAGSVLAQVSSIRKDLRRQKLGTTEPFRESARILNHEFDEILGPVEGIEQALRAQIIRYQAEQRRVLEEERQHQLKEQEERQAEENARAMVEEREAIKQSAVPIQEAPESIKTDHGTVGVRGVRRYRILDKERLPEWARQPDRGAINRAVKGGVESIPGCEVWMDDSVGVV
jgi:hypothetical protein